MKDNIICNKMLAYIDKILDYTHDKNYDSFIANNMLVEACVFNLSQLGELAGKLGNKFCEEHNNIPWKQIYGLRNRIVHDYDGVNLQLVWEIISYDIPELKKEIDNIIL